MMDRVAFTQMKDGTKVENMEVFDMVGRTVLRVEGAVVNKTIDLRGKPNGAYFVSAVVDGKKQVVRLIKY